MKIIITENQFERIVKSLLNEGRVIDSIYQKNYSKIDRDIFDRIISADPKTKIDKDIIGAGGQWLLNVYKRNKFPLEDLERANEDLNIYYRYKSQLKLNLLQLKSLSDLTEIVTPYKAKVQKTLASILNILPKDEYDKVYDGDDWVIYVPKTQKAAGWLGVNTAWCTAWGRYSLNDDYKTRECHFDYHNNQGPLYIIINKNDETEKYQLHFETRQFKDKNDASLDFGSFANRNRNVLYYFFPSFVRQTNQSEVDLQLRRIKFLPVKVQQILMQKLLKNVDNDLVSALINEDLDVIEELILGPRDIHINNNRLILSVDNLTDRLESLYEITEYYEYEANHGYEYVYEDVRELLRDKENKEFPLEKYLEEYFNQNKSIINSKLKINNFENFKNIYFDVILNDEDIENALIEDTIELSYRGYESDNRAELNDIESKIEMSSNRNGYDIEISLPHFNIFLASKNIDKISAEELDDVLDKYVDEHNLPNYYETVYYDTVYPKYGDRGELETKIDKFFDKIFESEDCVDLQKMVNDAIFKYFKGSDEYENDKVRIKIKSKTVDCIDQTIRIEYENKDTKEIFGKNGNDKIKVENFGALITNLKLF